MGPRIGGGRETVGTVAGETVQFSATQREAGDGAPGATAAFPYDRMTMERFRAAFLSQDPHWDSRAHGSPRRVVTCPYANGPPQQ